MNQFFSLSAKAKAGKYLQRARYFRPSLKLRATALLTGLSLAYQLVYPNVGYALTGGPSAPNFSSFEPVATTNMVNEFTGQFVYNIPVLEIPGGSGGGYAMSLSYHSGDGPESDASWVGYGWTLNPGSINRVRRGVPDDYNGQTIKYHNSMPSNWTIAATGQFGIQAFSGVWGVGANAYSTVRYNNYKGFGFTQGFGLSALKGMFSIGYHISDGTGSFSAAMNPAAIVSVVSDYVKTSNKNSGPSAGRQSRNILTNGIGQSMRSGVLANISSASSRFCSYLLSDMSSPYNSVPYQGSSISGAVSVTADPPPAPVGMDIGANIAYSTQKAISQRDVKAYGYMYSGQAGNNDSASKESIMDYTVERVSNYNVRDKYLPLPTSTPDAFFVSGEGVSGAFRMYNDRIGIFSPNYVESITDLKEFGVDLHVGLDLGVGGEVLLNGEHKLKVASSWAKYANGNTKDYWFVPKDFTDSLHQIGEQNFFRFNNDMGGKLEYDNNDLPIATGLPSLPYDLKVVGSAATNVRRGGRTSYIGYHTNKELQVDGASGKRQLAFEQNKRIHTLAGREAGNSNGTSLDNLIGEIAVYNEEGNSYVYGLPTYAYNEVNMQRGLSNVIQNQSNYIVGSDLSSNYKKVGEEYNSPYVTSYLLTQVTSPDYVDVNLNGPDKEDLGTYTRFMYRYGVGGGNINKTTGMNYHWRTPYKGMYYNTNKMSDNTDDMGGYQSGYRENYVLDTVETKTHYAVFYTSPRKDAYSAAIDDDAAKFIGVGTTGTSGYVQQDMLVKIKLFAKSTQVGQSDKLIKTVNFSYDYSAWPNTPNSWTGSAYGGKLTLKNVWFEYNGAINASVAPYTFIYTAPTSGYPAKYSNLLTASNVEQTPDYSPFIDCWGNYMDEAATRRGDYICSPKQNSNSKFDPAAWQLKQIILPSGGEIHVQYEQNTYSYVQNRRATVLVPLTNATNNAEGNVFELNTSILGVTTPTDKQELADLINQDHGGKYNKIYFKFLYTLLGSNVENLNSCNSEYIDGYAELVNAWVEPSTGNVRVQINTAYPRQVCIDYIQKEVGGKLKDGNCQPSGATSLSDPNGDQGKLQSLAPQFINAVKSALAPKLFACKAVNPDYSYLRVPVMKKKGGGIRVKRLLMYNPGVDPNTQTLYGNEYIYDNESTGESYGVATNEPYENKDENPLVEYMDQRREQTFWERMFQGRDKEQFEGPLSMNALPAASVGYSRIIRKNIHQDKYTGTGYSVIDYYTAKDYPFDMYYSQLGTTGASYTAISRQAGGPSVDIGLFSYTINTDLKSSQGYCFIKNDMHGQIRAKSDYSGMYDPETFYDVKFPVTPIAQQTFEYFEPGSVIPMMQADYTLSYDQPGKEVDVTVERRSVQEESNETRITGDITIGLVTPIVIPYVIGFPVSSSSVAYHNSLVTNKVVHYPAIMKRTTTMKDGYIQYTDYAGFDPLTVKPVMVRTYDSYDGLALPQGGPGAHDGMYTEYNLNATQFYKAMGEKAWNQGYAYYAPKTSPFSITAGGTAGTYNLPASITGPFKLGDELALTATNGNTYIGNITDMSSGYIVATVARRYNTTMSLGPYSKVQILRSSYTNMLNASMGGYTGYGQRSTKLSMVQFLADITTAWNYLKQPTTLAPDSVTFQMGNYAFKFNDMDCYTQNSWCVCQNEHMISKIVFKKLNTTDYVLREFSPYSMTTTTAGGAFETKFRNDPTNFLFGGFAPISSGVPGSTPASTFLAQPDGFSFIKADYVDGTLFLIYKDAAKTPQYNTALRLHTCPEPKVETIIKASVTKYADDWSYDTSLYHIPFNLNVYESNKRGKWRPIQTYVYKDATTNGNNVSATERNYNAAGTVPYFLFGQWDVIDGYEPAKWIRTSNITEYSPHGFATNELNALNIPSTAKYGYNGILPYVIAKNASFWQVRFESFENNYTNYNTAIPAGNTKFESNAYGLTAGLVNDGHTGKRGYVLGTSATQKVAFDTVDNKSGTGHLVRFWAKVNSSTANYTTNNVAVRINGIKPNFVTRTGEWALFEWANTAATAQITYTFTSPGTAVTVDDIRIAPVQAEVTCYVYDLGSYKLSAVLDDQHFATYYQYNGEGKLVRKMLETERGVKTVDEAYYNTPLRNTLRSLGVQPSDN